MKRERERESEREREGERDGQWAERRDGVSMCVWLCGCTQLLLLLV